MKSSSWVAVVAVVVVLGYILVNTLRTDGIGSAGVPRGERLPPFAVPTANNRDDEVPANTLVRARDGAPPACEVRVPESFTSCSLTADGPAVIAFLAAPSGQCTDAIDRLQALQARFPRVSFAVIAIRGDREGLRKLVRERGWTMPVGHDTDGRVSNAYAIAVCPTIELARRGGVVRDTILGTASSAELARRIGALARG